MELAISQLIEYAVRKNWLEEPPDRIWAANRILEALGQDGFDGLMPVEGELPPLQAILDHLYKVYIQFLHIRLHLHDHELVEFYRFL